MLGRVSLRALLAVGPMAVGCDFFQELEDAESADTGDSEASEDATAGGDPGASEDGFMAGPCTIERDDRCENQDVVASCDPATGLVTTVPCDALCGDNANFSCVSTAGGAHACWCVVPGTQKLWSCTELEACMADCDQPGPCTDQCFAKTTEATVRMYGALVHCAESGCTQTCLDSPEFCGPCIANAIASGEGCSIPRSICDADENDEGWDYP
ncbi:MAG: hypothetical protein AAF721_14175 [Myxococcota bacterium]